MARRKGETSSFARMLDSTGKRWIYAVLALLFLAYILLAFQSYRAVDRELTDAALSRRLSLARLAATTLSEKFDGLIHIGTSLATRVRFRELIDQGDWAGAGRILSSVPADFPFIERVFLTDIEGTETVDIPELPGGVGLNFAHRDWYKGVSRHWQPYLSPVYLRNARPQRNVFAVAVPVKADDGRVLAILVLQQDLEGFFNWVGELEIGPGGHVYFVDSKGQVAFHPRYPAQGEIVDYRAVPVVQKVLRGETGVEVTYNPIEREKHVSAFVPARHGWGVIAQQPEASVFAYRDRQLTRILTGYVLILLFCIIVVWLAIRLFDQRRHAEEDRRIKEALEQRVAERTAQLESVNKELESFSYSVSHDLRAPLRAIEGYSMIIEEDYGRKLDEEGRRLFGVIRDSSRRMSTLIDDLLAFSRLGRQAIRRVELDMGGLVETIVQEQRSNSGVDQVRFVMHPLPSARADPALLRQVWVNLLSNAVKYSGTRRQPVVEIGSRDENSQTVYYVRDNGAGFDMRFYDKLFAVFQRLHRAEDFPGTGIGLAIVHRIVTRHGGRVWAEGRVGEGATFYFTLAKEEMNERRH